jgi:hypothetical protein
MSICRLCVWSGDRYRHTAADDIEKARVPGDLEAYLDRLGRHATAVQRVRSQARPDYEAIAYRITGREAELEGVVGELGLAQDPSG